jgi:hypothetical protein
MRNFKRGTALVERRYQHLPFPFHQRKVLAQMRFTEKLTVRFSEKMETRPFQMQFVGHQ